MTELWTVVGAGICALVTLTILRELRREYAPLFLLGFTVLCFLFLLPQLGEAVAFLKECAERAGSEHLFLIVKALGITYLSSTASEICKSAGEASIGSTLEFTGRVELLLLCLPLFRELLDLSLLG